MGYVATALKELFDGNKREQTSNVGVSLHRGCHCGASRLEQQAQVMGQQSSREVTPYPGREYNAGYGAVSARKRQQ